MIMSGGNEENLKEIFERFLNSKEAEQATEDIQKAAQILREHPAPEPDDQLIGDIKANIAQALVRRRTNAFKRAVFKVTVVAAVFIIVATVSVKLFEKSTDKGERFTTASIMPTAIWESDDVAVDDVDLAVLTAEIEQVEDEILALQLGENGGNGSDVIMELEIELIEIDSDFWKG